MRRGAVPMTASVVVGAAVVRDRQVLAARRSAPAELAGRWEFPGGKVEPGEDDAAALVRECREELGVEIAVGTMLASTRLGDDLQLHIYLVELLLGEPVAMQDHDDLQWLAADDLDQVDWLPADLPAVLALRSRL
jgi:8-oxo-dGTP diphosphatase